MVDPTETPRETVQIPPNTATITLTPRFGGGYIVAFNHAQAGLSGTSINAPVSVTFNPDGTLSYPVPPTATA